MTPLPPRHRHFLFAGVGDNLIPWRIVTKRHARGCTMTLEEMDKKIEFILQMQAQFEANLARSETNINSLRISVAELAGVVKDSIKISDDRFTRLDDRLTNLVEAQKVAEERSARLDQRMMELTEAQKTTDERLNALISIMERHISGPDHAARP
jgi:chromosome segregation ATPase